MSLHGLKFNDYLFMASKPYVVIYSRYGMQFKNQLMC